MSQSMPKDWEVCLLWTDEDLYFMAYRLEGWWVNATSSEPITTEVEGFISVSDARAAVKAMREGEQ